MRSWPRLAAVLALFALACEGIDAQTNAFATLAEARDAGAIINGWVPEGLPPGTVDIREAHVPGTRERWGVVNFPAADADSLRALLQPDPIVLQAARADAPKRVEWWPLALRGDIDGRTLAAAGVVTYRARQGDLMFAVNWKQGRAYYWTERGR